MSCTATQIIRDNGDGARDDDNDDDRTNDDYDDNVDKDTSCFDIFFIPLIYGKGNKTKTTQKVLSMIS